MEDVMEAHKTHFFELETDGTLDLLEDSVFDALYEAGCDDALVGHRRLDFARRADTWEAALRSARADAESVPGVRIVAVKIDAQDIEAAPAADSASADASDRDGSSSARQKRNERRMEEGLTRPGVAEALRVYGNAKSPGAGGSAPRRALRSRLAKGADTQRTI